MKKTSKLFKSKNINLGKSIIKICLEEKFDPFFAVIQSSRIFFVSYKNFMIKGKIKEKEGFFIDGTFRKKTGKIFAISGNQKQINLLDISRKFLLRSLKGHSDNVYSSSFSNNGLTLFSGGNDLCLKLWDIPLQKCILSYRSHSDSIRSTAFFPGSDQICGSSSYDGKIKIHDLRIKNPCVKVFDHGGPVEGFKFFPNQEKIVSIGGNFIKIWDISQKNCFFKLKETKPLVNLVFFSKSRFLYTPIGQEIKLFDPFKLKSYPLVCFEKEVLSIETAPKSFLVGFSDGKICCQSLFANSDFFLKSKKENLMKSSPFFDRPKFPSFLGLKRKNPKIAGIFPRNLNKKIVSRLDRRKEYSRPSGTNFRSLSFLLQKTWDFFFPSFKNHSKNLDFLIKNNNKIPKDRDFLSVLLHLDYGKFSHLMNFTDSLNFLNLGENFFSFLRKLLQFDLLFSYLIWEKLDRTVIPELIRERDRFGRIRILQDFSRKILDQEV